MPRLCEFYPGICLTTEEKARKNLSQGKKNVSQIKENSKVYFLKYSDISNVKTNKMQRFLDLFISINCSTCFRQFLHPSSGAQNCTYSVRYCQTNTAGAAVVYTQ
jgi:hypothetical protein